jgi:hypothetical protein
LLGTFGHAEGDAAAGAAAIEAKDEAWLSVGAAMDYGIDAERAVGAFEQRRRRFGEGKAWPPHQRAIAKHPELRHTDIVIRNKGGILD